MTLLRKCLAEVAGTFILVFFGVGSVHAAVLTGAQQGLWQVAVVWGVAISLAIYATGALSGAHMNPAMTASFAVFRGFPWRQVPAYVLSQFVGAFLAAGADPVQLAAQEQTLAATRQILVDKLNHAYASRGRLLAVLVAVVVVMVIETLPQPSAGMVRARLTTARYALVALGLALLLAQPDWLIQLPVLFAGLLVAATLGVAMIPLAWRAESHV